MNDRKSKSLRDRLLSAGELWAIETGRSLGALSSLVMNHGGALERLRNPDKAVTDATLEKFARFLSDGANWPAGRVPQEVVDFAHVVGISADDGVLSAGKTDNNSPGASVGEAA